MKNRVAPQNLEAEESVLGAILLAEKAIDAVLDTGLVPTDFYYEKHGLIYSTALTIHAQNLPVDVMTLRDELEKRSLIEKVGGRIKLHELAAIVPSASNVAHYAKIVKEMASLRRLITAGQEITRLGQDRPGELDELIARAETALTQAVTASTHDGSKPLSEGLDDLMNLIREAYRNDTPIQGQLTGLRDLDAMLNGLWNGQLLILAARPSQGKSTLALNIAENICDAAKDVLFVSLEMSKREFQLKSLSRAARVNSKILARGAGMRPEQAQSLGEARAIVQTRGERLHIHDSGTATVPNIRADAARIQRAGKLGLVVVDYLQLMQGSGEENRTQEVAAISRGLKQLARKMDVPILALSQMSRNIEHRAEKRPVLADLRESGALEQDADVVMFLHSDATYNPDQEPDGTIEVIVAKQRQGETGTVKLAFNRTFSTFKTLGGGIT